MNPIVAVFAKKYVASLIGRAIQAVCLFVIAKGYMSSTDANAVASHFDASQVTAWLFGVGAELVPIIQHWGHAAKTVDAAAPADKPTPQHGATGLTCFMLLFFASSFSIYAQTNSGGVTFIPPAAPVTISPGNTNQPGSMSTNISIGLVLPVLSIGGSGVPTNVVTSANDILQMLQPVIPYLTNIHGVSLDADMVYSTSNKFGGIGALNFAIPAFSNYWSVGLAAEYIGDEWYVSPIETKLSGSWNIPIVNYPITFFVSDGPSVRFSDAAIGNQSIVGGALNINFGKGWYGIIDGGRLFLTQSRSPDANYFFGARVGVTFN